MQQLLDCGVDANIKDNDDQTSLAYAAIHNKVNIINALIDSDAEINAKNNHGQSSWFLALKNFNIKCFMIIVWYKIKLIF